MVGRDFEFQHITHFLGDWGGPKVLAIEGEPGIGKTGLVAAAIAAATDLRYTVLRASPTEAEAELPYSVLGDVLAPAPAAAFSVLSKPLRMALDVALLRLPAEQAPIEQLAVSAAFLRLIGEIAAAGSALLLVVDDLQWADPPSTRVLHYALHRIVDEPIKAVVASRTSGSSDPIAAMRKAVGDRSLERLPIGPLGREAIDDLLLARLSRPLTRRELEQVYVVSRGNPFFPLEVGRHIVSSPSIVESAEPLTLPVTLMEAIAERIASLPASAIEALAAMAAMTRPDEAVLQKARPELVAQLNAGLTLKLIERESGRTRFAHPLIASAVYAAVDVRIRRELHARLATVVADPEEQARHLALAATGPDSAVADSLEIAARSANSRGAPEVAATLAHHAWELTPAADHEAVTRRRILTAEYRMRAGDLPAARELLDDVLRSSPDESRPYDALRLLGTLALGGESLMEAESILVEALARAPDDRARASVERELARVLSQQGRIQEAFEHSVRLSELAPRCGDASLIATADRFLALAESRRSGRIPAEVRSIATRLADPQLTSPSDDNVGGLHPLQDWAIQLKMCDDFAHARILLKRALALTEGRDESLRAPLLFHLAEIEYWTGDWLLAAVYTHECERSVVHSGHASYARLHLVANAMLSYGKGRLDEAREFARRAVAISTAIGDEAYRRRSLAILGATELVAGRAHEANRHFEEIRSGGNHQAYRGVVRSEGDEIEALLAAGQAVEAEAVVARLETFDDPWQRAIGARSRGLIAAASGKTSDASEQFERALGSHGDLGMPLEHGRTLLAFGSLLRRSKQKRAARERLMEAAEAFQKLGSTVWADRAMAELSRVAPSPAADTLTPTEERIAALVATGMPNKEVAAELFLSVKTVEANLSRIYGKLGVRSRGELAARMASQSPRAEVR